MCTDRRESKRESRVCVERVEKESTREQRIRREGRESRGYVQRAERAEDVQRG
jgi:hypothetical protein